MIFVTGDIHGDPRRFNAEIFPKQKEMTKDDYVIILGDFGLVWGNTKEENYWLDWLNNKSFTTLFVDGNHENHSMIAEYPEVVFHGGKAHQIRDSVYHLMRGYVFDIGDKRFFAFGGASSHDIQDGILDPDDFANRPDEFRETCNSMRKQGKMFRVKGVSWWPEEIPSNEEMERGRQSLTTVNNEIDFVISHCAPQEIQSVIGFTDGDNLTQYFNELLWDGLKFDRWYFGHLHQNKQIMGKFICIYEQIIQIA